jgi:hypothetical protein
MTLNYAVLQAGQIHGYASILTATLQSTRIILVNIRDVRIENWIYSTHLTLTLTRYHISRIAIGRTRSSQSDTAFISCPNCGCFLSSGFPNYPRSQLPASNSDNSATEPQQPSIALTHQPTSWLLTCPAYSISARTKQETLFPSWSLGAAA